MIQLRLFGGGARPPQRCRFYLGTHVPTFFKQTSVHLFISRRRLSDRKTFPRARGRWSLDSGGFTELSMFGKWTLEPQAYVDEVRRYTAEIGNMDWAATQDWMCEPWITEKTSLTVEEHQRRTVASYLTLRRIAPDLPWSPAVQGWHPTDYLRCVEMYRAEGIDLSALPVVGVGSVCRRQHADEAVAIFESLHDKGIKLHGFGLKLEGLRRAAHLLTSADSLAWSFGARQERKNGSLTPHCRHPGSCANCLHYALQWRERVTSIDFVE